MGRLSLVTTFGNFPNFPRFDTKAGQHRLQDQLQEAQIAKWDLTNNISVVKKCQTKFDCLIYEILFINEGKLTLQSDSIHINLLT